MPWKKAWPTEVKQKLKTDYKLTNEQITKLENYGDLQVLMARRKEWSVDLALSFARADELLGVLKSAAV